MQFLVKCSQIFSRILQNFSDFDRSYSKDCYISDKCEKSLVGSAAAFQAKFAGIDRATSSKRPTARTGPSSFFAQPAAAIASTLAADRKVCVASKAAPFAEVANPTTRTDFHRRAARPSPRTSGIGWKGAALKRIPRVHHRRTSPAHITGANHLSSLGHHTEMVIASGCPLPPRDI